MIADGIEDLGARVCDPQPRCRHHGAGQTSTPLGIALCCGSQSRGPPKFPGAPASGPVWFAVKLASPEKRRRGGRSPKPGGSSPAHGERDSIVECGGPPLLSPPVHVRVNASPTRTPRNLRLNSFSFSQRSPLNSPPPAKTDGCQCDRNTRCFRLPITTTG